MTGWRASWRLALRIGRRDVRKAKGRSVLIVVMVGVPVLLTTLLTIVVASDDVSRQEGLPSQLGQAQASLSFAGSAVRQSPSGDQTSGSGDELRLASSRAAAERLLGVPFSSSVRDDQGVVRIGDRGYSVSLRGIDTRERITRGMYVVDAGRAPRSTGEILVNHALESDGARVGSRIRLLDRSFTVVGVGRPDASRRGGGDAMGVVLPGDLDRPGAPESTTFLVGGEPVTWEVVKKLNRLGFLVESREVTEHGITAAQQREVERALGPSSGTDAAARAVMVIVAASVMIEVVLLACPAFAVGVRRQRRELALLAASGAAPRQLRRVVLGQAAVLGLGASLVGALAGLGLGALVVRLGPALVPQLSLGPVDVVWRAVALAVVLGTVAAVAAAYVPALQASRQDVATVLAGRRGETRTRVGWPVVGLGVAAAGVVACFTWGTRTGGETIVAGSTLAVVVGFVLMTPAIVGLVGRLGTRLPLPLRIAVRDTARQRSRSAPAVAAIMASIAGITATAIGSASDFEQSRQEYRYTVAPGRAVVSTDAADLDRVVKLVEQRTGRAWVPMASAQSGDRFTDVQPTSDRTSSSQYVGTLHVADVATLRAWGVSLSASDRRFLEGGGLLSAEDGPMRAAGRARLSTTDDGGQIVARGVVPARPADLRLSSMVGPQAPVLSGSVISPATARRLDLPVSTTEAISPPGAPRLTQAQESDLAEQVAGVSPFGSVQVERGFQESWTVVLLALFAVAGVAVLVGTLTATALALNDARPDFATLAAIGAAPRTRRWTAGSQALVLALLGTALGVVVGFAPGVAIAWPLTAQSYVDDAVSSGGPTIAVPWLTLLALVVVVPLGAAAVATVFTRSRLTLVRRVAQ